MADTDLLEAYIEVYFHAFKYVGELISEPMKADGISFEQFLIMRDLAAGHQLGLSEIAKKRGVTRAAISRQIKTLLEKETIVQERDAVDRRRLYLRLTPHGEEVTSRVNKVIHKRFYDWVSALGEKDAKELLRIMRKVGTNIIAKDKSALK
ncbi:MarR family winged helix-turn-helix transcriptional regulator [Lacticaseibacillus baoqingensis]|uniref:MarR family winged helix-turn-helix transcriptional regulator n=1 Tax=Lacticaseibacillus baoqingensis TaxID=2486013 RepID=A0ABW4E5B7_9LACO|nr:MarR family transcriptional regulator [Lacticaseibacillus baoqingensis]